MATSKSCVNQNLREPLDTLRMQVIGKNGMVTVDSALHIGFMEPRKYIHFKSPPTFSDDSSKNSLQAVEEEWIECVSFFDEDLCWMLKLPHHRFWSQVVYDEELHKCLESYLAQAPRHYDLPNLKMKEEIANALKRIHKLVFLVFLRMSTYKESKTDHMTPEFFGNLIYENYVFDVPKIMDLCALYATENTPLVSKMVHNIFSAQRNYFDDLSTTTQLVLEAFSNIEEKLGSLHEVKHNPSNHQVNGTVYSSATELTSIHDVVNYIADVCFTLHSFLEVYTPACPIFYQNGATLRIATFYEHTFCTIEKDLQELQHEKEDNRMLQDVQGKVCLSKTLLVKTFRDILSYCCIQELVNSGSSINNSSENPYLNQFFDIFTEIAPAKTFLQDYNVLFPVEAHFELFSELDLKLDHERMNYILCCIHDSDEVPPPVFASTAEQGARMKTKYTNGVSDSPQTIQDVADMLRESSSSKSHGHSSENAESCTASGVEIDPSVDYVCEVLGVEDKQYIRRCLQYFGNDRERVIDAYVMDNIPAALKPTIFESDTKSQTTSEASILLERKSIFDNDEFDFFRREDINMQNVHLGKKNKIPSAYETLAKDRESDYLKQYTLARGSEETEYVDVENVYDDEYDDTYDTQMVGVKEPIPEGVPDADTSEDKKSEDRERKSDERSAEADEEFSRDTSRDFCENPEDVRQRYQQRREAKAAARGGFRRGGISSDDNRDRQHKDRNKTYVGNHNRRNQSDYKRSRGMFS